MWAFRELYDKGLIYEAYRVMPYSWGAETLLSTRDPPRRRHPRSSRPSVDRCVRSHRSRR
ncbi:MAG: class I tRNA ligase family protein [Acidimicrobiales bacterium]